MNIFPPNFGGAMRVFQIAKNLGELGCFVHLFIPYCEKQIELANVHINPVRWLNRIKYPIDLPGIIILSRSLINLIRERIGCYERIDAIQAEGLSCAPQSIALKYLLRKPTVLDEHNCETMLWYRIDKINNMRWKRLQLLEKACCRSFDHMFAVSNFDKNVIQSLFSLDPMKVTVVPNGVDINHFTSSVEGETEIRSKYRLGNKPIVLFTGRLSYFPNEDALRLIMLKIYPNIRKLMPTSVLMIVGTRPPQWLMRLKSESLIVTDAVDDVVPYIEASDVCIAPLRFGSGTRLKILEYMACEKPVISTKIGAEGLDVVNGKHLIIEEDIELFAPWIECLVRKKEYAKEIGKNARKLIVEKYTWKNIIQELISTYKQLI